MEKCDEAKASYYRKAVWNKTDSRLTVFEYLKDDGTLVMTGTYLDKKGMQKTDTFVYFHKNGTFKRKGNYIRNKREGKWVFYFDDNGLDGEGTYLNDKKSGTWIYYHTNGQKSSEELYADDKLQKLQAWYVDGTRSRDTCLEQIPEMPGGEEYLYQFLGRNIQYPVEAKENEISGKVIVTFNVDTLGNLSDFEIVKSPHPSLSKESLRVARLLPPFMPYCSHNRRLPFKYYLPLVYMLGN